RSGSAVRKKYGRAMAADLCDQRDAGFLFERICFDLSGVFETCGIACACSDAIRAAVFDFANRGYDHVYHPDHNRDKEIFDAQFSTRSVVAFSVVQFAIRTVGDLTPWHCNLHSAKSGLGLAALRLLAAFTADRNAASWKRKSTGLCSRITHN